jgi:hypothetical protein
LAIFLRKLKKLLINMQSFISVLQDFWFILIINFIDVLPNQTARMICDLFKVVQLNTPTI